MSHSLCEKTALRLIARAEQSVNGLTLKLEKRKFGSNCINEVVSRLIETGLLNDERFAQLWLESHLRLTRSPRRLLVSLCTRGIEREIAEAAIKDVFDEDTEFDMLTRFVKKYSRKKKLSDTQSVKFMLRNEGFSPLVIKRYLSD